MLTNFKRLLASTFILAIAASASAKDTNVTLSLDGKAALVLQAPAAAKVTSSNGYVNIRTDKMSLHVWVVPNASAAGEAVPRAAELIRSEFIKFKTTTVEDMIIADAPAKQVTGSGNEADDGDPGNAEVVFFVVGGHVFAGCVHGEFDDAARARAPMLAVLQTAHAPP